MDIETILKWDGDRVILIGKKVVNKSAFETGLIIEGDAKLLAPVKSGELAGSINTREERPGVVYVGTNLEYAPHVEFGTAAHPITVKTKKVLSDGKSVFGKKVNHPGTQAQPFLRPALLKAKGKSLLILTKNGKSFFGGLLKK